MRVPASSLAIGFAVAAVLASAGQVCDAQAPRITPSGDPSVRNDSIYSLAVRPRDYPDQAFVNLLEDGVLRFEEDGRSRKTFRQVVQILSPQAAEQFGDLALPY